MLIACNAYWREGVAYGDQHPIRRCALIEVVLCEIISLEKWAKKKSKL